MLFSTLTHLKGTQMTRDTSVHILGDLSPCGSQWKTDYLQFEGKMREEWGKGRGLPKSAWHRQRRKRAPVSAPGNPSILGLFTKPHPLMSRGKNKHHSVLPAGSPRFPLIRALHELFSFGEMWQKDSGTKDAQNNGCFYFPANWEAKIYCVMWACMAWDWGPMDSPHLGRLRVVLLCVGMAWGCHEYWLWTHPLSPLCLPVSSLYIVPRLAFCMPSSQINRSQLQVFNLGKTNRCRTAWLYLSGTQKLRFAGIFDHFECQTTWRERKKEENKTIEKQVFWKRKQLLLPKWSLSSIRSYPPCLW